MIKTIIFDLGNVIIPFDINTGVENAAKFSDSSDDEIREKFFDGKLSQDYHSGKISEDKFYESVKKSLDLRMSFQQFVDAWNSIFLSETILPDGLLEKLAQKHRLIILSDTNKLHFEFIKQNFSIMRHFDDFVLSHKVGFQKPSTEIFEAAIEKARCLPEECFYTDDKKLYIEKAKEFGIDAVQFISIEQFESELKKRRLIH